MGVLRSRTMCATRVCMCVCMCVCVCVWACRTAAAVPLPPLAAARKAYCAMSHSAAKSAKEGKACAGVTCGVCCVRCDGV
jgi:hypothetical protein